MKKLIVGLLAAFLMAAGFVTVSGAPSTAAPCPYSGCVDTRTRTVIEIDNRAVTITVSLQAAGSNATPKGKVTVTLTKVKKNGNLKQVDVISTTTGKDGVTGVNFKGLRPGKYKYTAKYEKNQDRGFRNSTDKGGFRVRR